MTEVTSIEAQHSLSSNLAIGVTIFLSAAYAPFIIATLLSPSADPTQIKQISAMIFGIFAFGTLISTLVNRLPLVLAPGIGLAAFFNQTITVADGSAASIHPSGIILAFLGASLFVTAISFIQLPATGRTIRLELIKCIPPSLLNGINSGIGALLLATSYSLMDVKYLTFNGERCIEQVQKTPISVWLVFGVVTFMIFWWMFTSDSLNKKFTIIKSYSFRVSFALIFVFVGSYILFNPPPFAPECVRGSGDLYGLKYHLDNFVEGQSLIGRESIFQIVAIFLIATFVMTFDIPGSPYHFLNGRMPNVNEENTIINNGFRLDGLVSIVCTMCGINPAVYYAENTVIEHDPGNQQKDGEVVVHPSKRHLWSGLTAALFFGLISILLYSLEIDAEKLRYAINFSVSSLLAATGLRLVAATLTLEGDEAEAGSAYVHKVKRNLPTAILLTLIPLPGVGFEFAFPLALLAFLCTRSKAKTSDDRLGLGMISVWSGITVAFWGLNVGFG